MSSSFVQLQTIFSTANLCATGGYLLLFDLLLFASLAMAWKHCDQPVTASSKSAVLRDNKADLADRLAYARDSMGSR